MNCLTWSLLVLQAVGTPVFEIPDKYFTEPMSRVPLNRFYPEGVSTMRARTKVKMEYGTPSAEMVAISDYIDSIPVEKRLAQLEEFEHLNQRSLLADRTDSWYQKHLVASSYIDIRLLRLLLRFATGRLNHDERWIRNACQIINYLRNKFSNGDFDYLTPAYVLDWYNGLGAPSWTANLAYRQEFIIKGLSNHTFDENVPSQPTDDKVLLQVTLTVWRSLILSTRTERLLKTGYEDLL